MGTQSLDERSQTNTYPDLAPLRLNTRDYDTSYDDSIMSFESPKPMGPKKLPEYSSPVPKRNSIVDDSIDSHEVSFNGSNYLSSRAYDYSTFEGHTVSSHESISPLGSHSPGAVPRRPKDRPHESKYPKTRQFQQLSKSVSNPEVKPLPNTSLPYPYEPNLELSFDDVAEYGVFEEAARDDGGSTRYHGDLSFERPSGDDSRLGSMRTTQIIHHSMSTPNKIPHLHSSINTRNKVPPLNTSVSTPSKIPQLHSSMSTRSSPSFSPAMRRSGGGSSPSVSPTGSPLRSPTRFGRGDYSPTRSQTLGIPRRSPQSSPRTSRSSSPRKLGRSPSLLYGQFQDIDENNVYEDSYYGSRDVGYPHGPGINPMGYPHGPGMNSMEIDDYPTPVTEYFDYSILPELPLAPSSASPSKSGMYGSPFATQRNSVYSNASAGVSTLPKKRKDDALPPVPLDLPQLPFSAASLVSQHFSNCDNVWLLSHIFKWCLQLRIWLHDLFIPRREFKKALIKLLVFHRREMPLDVISRNVDQIIASLLSLDAISFEKKQTDEPTEEDSVPQELGVVMKEGVFVSGVLTEMTDCYYNGHNHENKKLKWRCYSSHCHLNRTIDHELRLKNTNIHEIVLGEDWAQHWKLLAADLKGLDSQLSKKQSLLFDLLRYEQTFIQRAECFVEYVGPEFIKAAQVFVGNDIVLLNKFEDDVLKPGKELLRIHRLVLFEPLLRVLIEDGRYITNVLQIAETYATWSVEVKGALLRYMSTMPMIEDLLSQDQLKNWVDVNVRNMKRVKELKVNGPLLLISTFNSRYQQLPLQLHDIIKLFDPQDSEYAALSKALETIKKLGSKVNEMKVHADNIHALKKIHKQLIWKSSITQPHINLGLENRRFVFRGDVSRKGDLKINSYTNHLILLDNYLFITERTRGQKIGLYCYKVVETPIPVELMIVEQKEAGGGLDLTRTRTSALGALTGQAVPVADDDDDVSAFPFKVRFAGRGKHNSYTFTTKTDRERSEWLQSFTQARTNLCARLRKSEPYSVQLVSNHSFAYERDNRITKLQICAPDDPIYTLSKDGLTKLQSMGYTGDVYGFSNARNYIVYSTVLAFCEFQFRNSRFLLVGVSSGIYCTDSKNIWKKIVSSTDVSKICVDTATKLVLILGNKQLRYYSLELIVSVYYEKKTHITSVSLSNDPVAFFAMGRHREITMLFYANKKSNSLGLTNFKVLIPETDNAGVFSAFKVVKKFYIQADCYGISIFNTSFAVHTNKGFEILELDKLLPRSIPEIPQDSGSKKIDGYSRKLLLSVQHPGIENIKKYVLLASARPMGMFKLTNNSEFLLVYCDCAVFINKHGKLSRSSFLRFEFKARSVAFRNNHLFIVTEEVIEVWAINDNVSGSNKLIQVLTGKDINMLNGDLLAFQMANPLVPGLQLVFMLGKTR